MNTHERLKRAFRLHTGVRLSADDVTELLLGDVAIRDAIYSDREEFVRDCNGDNSGEDKQPRGEGEK